MQVDGANVVLLYGAQACAALPQMLSTWDAILDEAVWRRFLICILDTQTPALPNRMLSMATCLHLKGGSGHGAGEIAKQARERLGSGGNALIHCIISCDEKPAIPLETFEQIVEGIKEGLHGVDTSVLSYLVLQSLPNRRSAQAQMLQALEKLAPKGIYLVGDTNSHGSIITPDEQMHALHCEVLANAGKKRSLANRSGLYSVGFSTLNANGTEMTTLLDAHVDQQALNKAEGQSLTVDKAWQLLTGRPQSQSVPRQMAKDWLKALAVNSGRFHVPTGSERRVARVTASLYTRPPEDIRAVVDCFFQLNTGNKEQLEQLCEQMASGECAKLRAKLGCRLNVGGFPTEVLEIIAKALEEIGQEEPHTYSSGIVLPTRGWATSVGAWRKRVDEYCEKLEQRREQKLWDDIVRQLALAMRPHIEALGDYIHKARERLAPFIRNQSAHADQVERLKTKYLNYNHQIASLIDSEQAALDHIMDNNDLPLLDDDANPIAESWQSLRRALAQHIEHKLPSGYCKEFSSALHTECGDEKQLQNFFSRYLQPGDRMFPSTACDSVDGDELYLVDQSFEDHPWVKAQIDRVLPTRSDNIERVDLYSLSASAQQVLQEPHSQYFSLSEDNVSSDEQGSDFVRMMFDASADEGAQPPSGRYVPSKPPVGADHHLRIVRDKQGRHILMWDWKPGSAAAVIKIRPAGSDAVPEQRTITVGAYNAPVGSCPNGVDIGTLLGKHPCMVEVSIHEGGRPYAWAKMEGLLRKVTYRKQGSSGGVSLSVEAASSSDVCKAVIECVQQDQTVRYPLYSKEKQLTLEGLELPSSLRIVPSPLNAYPDIYVIEE